MKKHWKRIVAVVCLAALLVSLPAPIRVDAVGSPGQIVKVTGSTSPVYAGPSTSKTVYGEVVRNSYFTILDVVQNEGKSWYKIPYRGVTAYLAVNDAHQTTMNSRGPFKPQVERQYQITDQAFEKTLRDFPESYRPALRALHTKYPNWVFEAAPASHDWKTSVDMQMANQASNTAQYYDGSAFLEPYLYMVRNWNLIDAGHNYPANRAGVSYFMDPRNFLNETDIFQFEQLTYVPDVHTLHGVETVLGGNAELRALAPALMEAGRQTGVSPYFLASRAKQEISADANRIINSARGDIDLAWPPLFSGERSISFLEPAQQLEQLRRYRDRGHRFNDAQQEAHDDLEAYFEWDLLEEKLKNGSNLSQEEKKNLEYYRATQPLPIAAPKVRYYNLFNIQATPATGVVDGNRINGVIFAAGKRRSGGQLVDLPADQINRYQLPWTSYEEAAVGGALFIGRGYILSGQDTLYHQKYNVNGAVWHQYMSNLTAPYSEGRFVARAYRDLGILDRPFCFKIPVFDHMPENTAIPEVVSLNISNDPTEEPGSELPLVDPEEVETEPVDSPQQPLDPEGKPIRNGDINGDGKINAADRLMLTRHILDLKKLEGTAVEFADINGDGRVDSMDRLLLTRHILYKEPLP